MKISIDDLDVYFPYDYIYPEQYYYMVNLKKTLDARGHGMIEMPSGTGKTISLLALIVSYLLQRPDYYTKLIYCSRTVPEMDKVMKELEKLVEYIKKEEKYADTQLVGVALSARRNLCVHPTIESQRYHDVDRLCYHMTASHIRRSVNDPHKLCEYFEGFDTEGRESILPAGIYNLQDLRRLARAKGWCPYFMARTAVLYANIVVYSYYYILDPKISDIVSKQIGPNTVVVFDEAHNIDNVCIDVMSIGPLRKQHLHAAAEDLKKFESAIGEFKSRDEEKLQEEYQRMLAKVRDAEALSSDRTPIASASPLPPVEQLAMIQNETMPGSIRKVDHYLGFVHRFLNYLKARIRVQHVVQESTPWFLKDINQKACIERRALRHCSERFQSLIRLIEYHDPYELRNLSLLMDFATLVSTFDRGFTVLVDIEHGGELFLSCMDSSIAIKHVFSRFKSVIITSGTLSPLDIYVKMLDFNPVLVSSLTMTLARRAICPVAVSRGHDQLTLSSRYESRDNPAVMRNYGLLIRDLCNCVPDGMVCFFTCYAYLEKAVKYWNEEGMINEFLKQKLIFIETKDSMETSHALYNYRKACDSGRGALMLCVARGKVAEGVDFEGHYGRCVIMVGIPYMYTESRLLHARLDYLRESFRIHENEFLTFDAMRHAAQCLGRVLRGKTDYGLMVLADIRFCRADKRRKLPKWIREHLNDSAVSIGADEMTAIAKKWFKEMAQVLPDKSHLGISVLTEDQLNNTDLMTKLKERCVFD